MLVSGVRSSWLASVMKRRMRFGACPAAGGLSRCFKAVSI